MKPKIKEIYNLMLGKRINYFIIDAPLPPINILEQSEVTEIMPHRPEWYNIKEWAKKLLEELIDESGG